MTAIKDVAVGGILVIIAFVIVLSILPSLTSAVADAQADPNTSGVVGTILDLVPLIFVAGILGGAVVFLVQGFKKAGG